MQGLAGAIRDAGHQVVSVDVTVRGLLASAAAHRPDVCLIDSGLAGAAGELLGRLRSTAPGVRVVLLSGDRWTTAPPAVAGPFPVVTRNQPLAAIVAAVADTGRAARRIPAGAARPRRRSSPPWPPSRQSPPSPPSPGEPGWLLRFLTEREWQVLTLLAAGQSTDRIGASLGVRPTAARAYVQRMLEKLGVHSRLEATDMLTAYRRQRSAGRRADDS